MMFLLGFATGLGTSFALLVWGLYTSPQLLAAFNRDTERMRSNRLAQRKDLL